LLVVFHSCWAADYYRDGHMLLWVLCSGGSAAC